MTTFLRRLTYGIRRKLLVSFSAVGIALIVVLGLFFARVMSAGMARESEYYIGKVVTQLVHHLDSYVDQMESILMAVALSADLPPFLEEQNVTAQARHETFSRINTAMLSAISTRPFNDLLLVVKNRRYILSTDQIGSTGELDVEAFEASPFYRAMSASPASIRVVDPTGIPIPSTRARGFALALDARAVLPGFAPNTCFLVVTSALSFFDDLVANVADDVVDNLVITAEGGVVIYSSADLPSPRVLEGTTTLRLGSRDYFVTPATSRTTGWTVYFLSSNERIRESGRRVSLVLLLSVAAGALAMLGLSYLISTRITRPIHELTRLMRRVEADDLSARAGPGPNDEVGDLHRSFDAMVGRIDRLVNELMRSRILTREAELYALQQQVNPHFLYNALETVNSLANQRRFDEIRTVIQKMAGIFRYCMGHGPSETVRLAEELQYVRDYLDIQEMRFRGRVQVTYRIDDAVLDAPTPKFVLQPLVENALRHGLRETEAGGLLSVRAALEEGCVLLEVEDNGRGMEAARLDALNTSLAAATDHPLVSPEGIGLHNVQARIRLVSRGRHGVRLYHGSTGGLRATVRIPA